MLRTAFLLVAALALPAGTSWAGISGDYIESRTCDIYTGPCFANSEVGLTGHEAILAWQIDRGSQNGVDLAGLRVVMAVRARNTLAYGGGMAIDPRPERCVILVDARATAPQRDALVEFARKRAGKLAGQVSRVASVPIEFRCNHVTMIASVRAGSEVQLTTRKLTDGDHCCTNEEVYYPPLAAVDNAAPAVTESGGFGGRGLGVRWQNPQTRSAFLATFAD